MGLNLAILRQAGFFREYENLSEEDLLTKLHEKRRKQYSLILGSDYEPEKIKDDYELALQDTKKFLDIDMESDVCAQNKVYVSLLESFVNISNGYFSPTNIEEIWDSEVGPIKVSFISNGNKTMFEPEYIDDWIDDRVFAIIHDAMLKGENEKLYLCAGPNKEWFGQNVIYVRLTEVERKLLEEILDWKFLQ